MLSTNMDPTTLPGHSALYFGATRDHWWHLDQLELCVKRFELQSSTRILDVGAGIGHWGRLLARVLAKPVALTGVDREGEWVAEATRRAAKDLESGLIQGTFQYLQGDARALAFADASFDLVTCQTLLIHVAEPRDVLREMARVLRPGGRLVVAEPNNLGNHFASLIGGPDDDIDAILRESRFKLLCERGKARLGLGFNSLGEVLPKLLDPALFSLRDVVCCDRTSVLMPPYASLPEQDSIAEVRSYVEKKIFCWPRDESRSYFEAGGGSDFDAEWEFVLSRERARLAQIDAGTYATVSPALHYFFCADRK